MRILVQTLHYLPDGGPSAPLFAMLCEALVRRGHKVTVVAAVPHYPSGQVQEEYRSWRVRSSVENGVRVVRIPVPSVKRSRMSQRLVQWLVYQIGTVLSTWKESFDVGIYCSPTLTMLLPFAYHSFLRKHAAVYSVHDVYPQVGIALGIFRKAWVISLVSSMEKLCLKRSAYVRILSESFAPPLEALGVPEKKLVLIYDWVDTNLIRPGSKENRFSRENGLTDKFVVQYAGNIGLSQGLGHVLEAARELASHEDILFLFVGDGTGRERLENEALEMGLANVKFLPFQPRPCLPEVLASADLSLVTLRKGITTGSLPSKSFSILSSGRPILASVDEDSNLALLIERSKAGVTVPPEEPHRLAEAILSLKGNPTACRQMGVCGREYVEKYHSPDSAAIFFEELLQKACERSAS
jgi:putative colanic acid biosynthesis glycosyltransferase WcaI